MTRYLLGQLPEEQQAELEHLYLADDDLYEQLLSLEDDLRDAYVRNQLSNADREAFEQMLLAAPRQKQDQKFARDLCQYLEGAPTGLVLQRQSFPKWKLLLRALSAQRRMVLVPALSFTILVLIAGGVWLAQKRAYPPAAGSRDVRAAMARCCRRKRFSSPR